MTAQVIDLGHHGHAVGQQGLVFGAVAEIGAYCRLHFAHPRLECGLQPGQVVHPLRVVGFARAPGRAQAFEGGGEVGDGGLRIHAPKCSA